MNKAWSHTPEYIYVLLLRKLQHHIISQAQHTHTHTHIRAHTHTPTPTPTHTYTDVPPITGCAMLLMCTVLCNGSSVVLISVTP